MEGPTFVSPSNMVVNGFENTKFHKQTHTLALWPFFTWIILKHRAEIVTKIKFESPSCPYVVP
nr:hypothetical protein Iba_chr13eCG6290 [Ipomoea batatas]